MNHDQPYHRHLLHKTLIRGSERLPAAAYTFWTILLVTISLIVITLVENNPRGF